MGTCSLEPNSDTGKTDVCQPAVHLSLLMLNRDLQMAKYNNGKYYLLNMMYIFV